MKVSDTQQQIGKVLAEDAHRDAIHIAVAPVKAGERLWPGQHVGFKADGSVGMDGERIGIVDPLLKDPVYPGTTFYLFLYPNSITDLRHEWTHPAFAGEKAAPLTVSDDDHKIKSKEWLEGHAAMLDLTFNKLMSDAEEWLEYGEHQVQHGSENWRDSFNAESFWHHYEIYTGKSVPAEKKEYGFYCCTC